MVFWNVGFLFGRSLVLHSLYTSRWFGCIFFFFVSNTFCLFTHQKKKKKENLYMPLRPNSMVKG